MLSNFLVIPVVREKIKGKLAPAIPTGASTTLTEEIIQTPPLVALKTIKFCRYNKNIYLIYLIKNLLKFLLHNFL